jgi:hypothetical protein
VETLEERIRAAIQNLARVGVSLDEAVAAIAQARAAFQAVVPGFAEGYEPNLVHNGPDEAAGVLLDELLEA